MANQVMALINGKIVPGTYINPDYRAGILPLYPNGTNSTFFTACCSVAICNDQRCCPSCGREVVGCDIENHHERGLYRWKYAYKGKKR